MNSRSGFTSLVLLLLLSLAGALTLRDALVHSQRIREISLRQQRLQAREYALAARQLAPGGALAIGRWTLVRERDGATVASGPAGSWRIAEDGSERWIRR